MSKIQPILLFLSLAILMFALSVIGAFRSYSPVPFWDMWTGYLEFFIRVSENDISAWWELHNEHRIILSRILFWIDLKLIGGEGWFLIVANYALVGLAVLCICRMLREMAATEKPEFGEIILGLFLCAWLFQWMQHENLTWGFQSQFILAQILPLWALYFLHKSVGHMNSSRYFMLALCSGIASIGTMANGILALPLMTVYALLTRQTLVRIGVLACLSVASLSLYFHDYLGVEHNGSPLGALMENPSGFIQFILLYLGNPFYTLVRNKLNFLKFLEFQR